ncbi:hypothetical protein [Cupriavidus sp. UME77]|uniref:hypothetical protein n=1 Tax=Cupriavidus sp. UME77 TaxID=1862321 RepID=UPI0021052178|nr:hypothetical protein [Cupriavidus sp. UME77]
MGNILQRERKDESIGYAAVIRLKQGGKVVLTETKTFDRRQAAATWMENACANWRSPARWKPRSGMPHC